jgi:hypothetical protein
MRYILIILSILIFSFFNSYSQDFSNNVVSTVDEAQKKFTGRRNLTIEFLVNKNYDKVNEILNNPLILSLPSGYEENLQSFYKEEITLLMFWLGEHQNILDGLTKNSKLRGAIVETGKEQQSIIPYKNTTYDDILELSFKNQKELKEKISSSNLESNEVDFLLLYLDFRLAEAQLETFDKESLISEAKKYSSKYPDNDLTDFVASNINVDYKTSNFGLGSTLFIGGYSFTDNLGENISGGMPVGGLINVAYKNLILDFHFTGSLMNKVKQDFNYQEEWEKNTRATLAFGSLSLGYALINNDKMMFAPSIGLSTANISSYIRSEERGEVNLKIDNMPILHTSLTFDYRIKRKTHINEFRDRLIAEFDRTYWNIRLKAGFISPNFEDENNVFKGNIFYIGAGIGIFTYPAIAIKQK